MEFLCNRNQSVLLSIASLQNDGMKYDEVKPEAAIRIIDDHAFQSLTFQLLLFIIIIDETICAIYRNYFRFIYCMDPFLICVAGWLELTSTMMNFSSFPFSQQ